MSETAQWKKELKALCIGKASDEFISSALEELTESCYGDSPGAQAVIEELKTSYHADPKKLDAFVKKVARNCPGNEEKELEEIEHDERDYAEGEEAETEEFTRNVPERDGVR